MKANKNHNAGSGIAIGSAIGIALGFAIGKNSSNTMPYIAMGLVIGVGIGAIIDFLNRSK
jgi:lipoprotein signal peptidase